MVRSRLLGVGAAAALMTLAACGDSTTSSSGPAATAPVATASPVATCATGSINIDGSSAIKALVQSAADEYQKNCPGSTITVAASNSSTGVTKAASHTVDIGDSDVPATLVQGVDPATVTDHPIAIVLFAVAVNPGAGVTNLTQQQIRDIFSGKVTNWKDVGGADLAIQVFERKAGSGTRLTFDKDIMQGTAETASPAGVIDTTATVVTTLKASTATGGVSYLAYSSVQASPPLVAVSIDGHAPSASAVADGTYPFFSHEHMFTAVSPPPSLLALSFIQYIQSPGFQTGTLTKLAYLPLSTTTRKAAVDQ
jgi:phosphate transport system substrate-binding protein